MSNKNICLLKSLPDVLMCVLSLRVKCKTNCCWYQFAVPNFLGTQKSVAALQSDTISPPGQSYNQSFGTVAGCGYVA